MHKKTNVFYINAKNSVKLKMETITITMALLGACTQPKVVRNSVDPGKTAAPEGALTAPPAPPAPAEPNPPNFKSNYFKFTKSASGNTYEIVPGYVGVHNQSIVEKCEALRKIANPTDIPTSLLPLKPELLDALKNSGICSLKSTGFTKAHAEVLAEYLQTQLKYGLMTWDKTPGHTALYPPVRKSDMTALCASQSNKLKSICTNLGAEDQFGLVQVTSENKSELEALEIFVSSKL